MEFNGFLSSLNLPLVAYKERQSFVFGRFMLEASDINDNNRDGLSNHLRWAISQSIDNSLWLVRQLDEETQKTITYLLTHDTDEPKIIYKEKDTSLKRIKTEMNISSDDIVNINQSGRFTNIELIGAIYSKLQLTPRWS